jgi:hypothetical protein
MNFILGPHRAPISKRSSVTCHQGRVTVDWFVLVPVQLLATPTGVSGMSKFFHQHHDRTTASGMRFSSGMLLCIIYVP